MPALSNLKWERFCREYVIDLNATQAYTRAGYSPNGAGQSAEKLLRNPEIVARIAELQADVCRKLEITQEMVVAELAKLGFSNMRDYLDDDGGLSMPLDDRAKMAAVSEYVTESTPLGKKTRFKLVDKRGPLVDLGKHIGMWPQKSEVNVNIFENVNAGDQRAIRDTLEALARDKGEDAGGAKPTHH